MSNEPTKLDISDEMIAERRGGSGQMPEDMPKWMALTITKIDLAKQVDWQCCLLDYYTFNFCYGL